MYAKAPMRDVYTMWLSKVEKLSMSCVDYRTGDIVTRVALVTLQ